MSKKTRFRHVLGCDDVRFSVPPDFTKNKRPRGSRRAGLSFERGVGEVLEWEFGDMVLHSPWISYKDVRYGKRVCCPDFLVVDVIKGIVTVVECKLSHVKDAWVQINKVYKPVVEKLFPGFRVRGIEICKNFEVCKPYPAEPVIVMRLRQEFSGGDNVMVMRDV